jgi:hypothetical protein
MQLIRIGAAFLCKINIYHFSLILVIKVKLAELLSYCEFVVGVTFIL